MNEVCSGLYECARDWQTLIAGLLALGAAGVTAWLIRRQIRQNDELELSRIERESYAARAVLPAALSELIEYAGAVLRAIDSLPNAGPAPRQAGVKLPLEPTGLAETFRQAIRYADRERRRELADLLHWFQVHSTRLRAFWSAERITDSYGRMQVNQALTDAAELYARAADLFSYARREDIEGRIERLGHDRLQTPLFLERIADNRPDLMDHLRKARPQRSVESAKKSADSRWARLWSKIVDWPDPGST